MLHGEAGTLPKGQQSMEDPCQSKGKVRNKEQHKNYYTLTPNP